MTTDPQPTPIRASAVVAVLGAWLLLATLFGAMGWVAKLRPPLPQVVLIGLTGALIATGLRVKPFRDWLRAVDVRPIVAIHLTRLVAGGTFVVMGTRGTLAPAFAIPAGWGDVAVAVLGVGVLFVSPSTTIGRRLYLAWNVFGLTDILFVVVNAAVQAVRDPAAMTPLLRLPLSLLPTFLVPIVIATHVLLFVRLRRSPV
jgi:hypothetical protein